MTSETEPATGDSILVAEDDANIRQLLGIILRRVGYAVHEATNGREAIAQMKRRVDRLVILDLMMPEVSGFDVLEARRHDPALLSIGVIVISAYRGPEISGVLAADICALLPKPFEPEVLVSLVRSCLAHDHGLARRTTSS